MLLTSGKGYFSGSNFNKLKDVILQVCARKDVTFYNYTSNQKNLLGPL